jgi:predicted RNA polymerase sigma factor
MKYMIMMGQAVDQVADERAESGQPLSAPTDPDVADRLPKVLHALYRMFSDGHAESGGANVARQDLSDEAIRLARLLHSQAPDQPEVSGLLALMLLTEARRAARSGPNGELIPLSEQDRNLWDHALIAEGQKLLTEALPQHVIGYYQVHAAIAALHDEAATAEQTDWPQILALHQVLERITHDPMVTLNLAIPTAMIHGPSAGLAIVDNIGSALGGNHWLDAVKAHLLEMAGDHAAAIEHYQTAASRTASIAERDHLISQAARIRAGNNMSSRPV